MRCNAMGWGLVLVFAAVVGCSQQCFLHECDYDHYRELMPQALECTADPCIQPDAQAIGPPPTTVLDPERPIRYMSLAECTAIALEKGNVSGLAFLAPGAAPGIDILLQAAGGAVRGSDNIRVLALDPAAAQTDIESSLSKFDAHWVTSMNWTTTDQPVATAIQNFQALGTGVNVIDQQQATFSTTLVKPLPTGGVAGITFNVPYTISNLAQRVNPAYTPQLLFGFEQPLFQGFGTEINQLRAAHPGSQLFQFNNVARTSGILITRITYDEERTQFEFNVSGMILNVEAGYWNLYGAYWTLYSREEALRQAYETWRINKAQYEAGRIAIQDFAQSRGQYELFRAQRFQALGAVLDAERRLRGVINLPVEDGTRIVPIDAPTVAPYTPDWNTALSEAMAQFPSLILARQDLKVQQLTLINEKNLLLPDVRFQATYDFNSIGSQLDGGGNNNAFKNLANGSFSDWSIGVRADIPLGYRDAHAAVRQQRLRLAQSYLQLRDQELKVQRALALAYRNIFELHERIKATRAEREAFADVLSARFKQFLAGRATINFLLEAQRDWANALADEYSTIVQYNQALASFEFTKGTLLQYNNVVVAEGQLPKCAQVRAVDHERERSKALLLHEHAEPIQHAACCLDDVPEVQGVPNLPHTIAGLPMLPADRAPSLPALAENRPSVPVITEPMPPEARGILQKLMPTDRTTVVPTSGQMPPMGAVQTLPPMASQPMPVGPSQPGSLPFSNAATPMPATRPTASRPGTFTNDASAVMPDSTGDARQR